MSEKRFIVESVSIIDDCNEDKSRITKVITDKEEIYSYDDLYEIVDLLNEQQATIRKLQDLCGESDSKNVKLRIENKRLQEENKELEDEHDDFSNFLIDKGLEFEFEKWCKDE